MNTERKLMEGIEGTFLGFVCLGILLTLRLIEMIYKHALKEELPLRRATDRQ
jgi:hypothetical protein